MSVNTERTPLLIQQPASAANARPSPTNAGCSCRSCEGCLKRFYPYIIAGLGGVTALHGAFEGASNMGMVPVAKLMLAMLAWGTATGLNASAAPENNLKKLMIAQFCPQMNTLLSVASGLAAISSGFLAIATARNIVQIIKLLLGSQAQVTVSWLYICIGVFFLVMNTLTSWNVGNAATANFGIACPKIMEDLRDPKTRIASFLAIVLAFCMNVAGSAAYSDGIADAITTTTQSQPMESGAAGFQARLAAGLFGDTSRVTVDHGELYNLIYWAIFGISGAANSVALTTFTAGPSYEFFFARIKFFMRIKESIEQATLDDRVEQNPWQRKIFCTLFAAVFAFAYGQAFAGFNIGVMEEWNLGTPEIRTLLGFVIAGTSWGPTLFWAFYDIASGIANPNIGRQDPDRITLEDNLLGLMSVIDRHRANGPRNFVLHIEQDQPVKILQAQPGTHQIGAPVFGICYRLLARDTNFALVVAQAQPDSAKPEQLDRAGMVGLLALIFSAEQLERFYDKTRYDMTTTYTQRQQFHHKFPNGSQSIFEATACYSHGGTISIQIAVASAQNLQFTALDMSDMSDQRTIGDIPQTILSRLQNLQAPTNNLTVITTEQMQGINSRDLTTFIIQVLDRACYQHMKVDVMYSRDIVIRDRVYSTKITWRGRAAWSLTQLYTVEISLLDGGVVHLRTPIDIPPEQQYTVLQIDPEIGHLRDRDGDGIGDQHL